MKYLFLVILFCAFYIVAPSQNCVENNFEATGSIYIGKINGNYSFISPQGKPFVAIGIAHANMPSPHRRLPNDATSVLFENDEELFNQERDRWLIEAGFNTFSYTEPAKTGNKFFWVKTLNIFPAFVNNGGECIDLFSDSFRNRGKELINKNVPSIANDPYLIGISLGLPVLASPHQMPTRTWERRNEKPTNYFYYLQSLDRFSTGKKKYIGYLADKFGEIQTYCRKRNWEVAASWEELLDMDLSVFENPFYLHPDDTEFYQQMWGEVISIFAEEVRKLAPAKIVFSPRLVGLHHFPDKWLDEWFKGVGPSVDAFIPELYGDNDYIEILNRIGSLTGKPTFIGDGMRPLEYNFTTTTDDAIEALMYEKMFGDLLKSPWFLGATVCEYHTQLPAFPWYAKKIDRPRLGIRNVDYSNRLPLLEIYKKMNHNANSLRKATSCCPIY